MKHDYERSVSHLRQAAEEPNKALSEITREYQDFAKTYAQCSRFAALPDTVPISSATDFPIAVLKSVCQARAVQCFRSIPPFLESEIESTLNNRLLRFAIGQVDYGTGAQFKFRLWKWDLTVTEKAWKTALKALIGLLIFAVLYFMAQFDRSNRGIIR